MPSGDKGERTALAPSRRYALAEFLVVGGASLAVIFWIIPSQTSAAGTELGLSPRMLPTVCAGAIGVLALVRLVRVLMSSNGALAEPVQTDAPAIWFAMLITSAAITGIVAIRYIGWPAGGAVLSLLVILVLCERRWSRLLAMPIGVAALLYLIQMTGI